MKQRICKRNQLVVEINKWEAAKPFVNKMATHYITSREDVAWGLQFLKVKDFSVRVENDDLRKRSVSNADKTLTRTRDLETFYSL